VHGGATLIISEAFCSVHGARNGVNAALVVHSGWTGVDDILSGPKQFLESYNPKADPAGLISIQLGEVYWGDAGRPSRSGLRRPNPGKPARCTRNSAEAPPFQADQVKQVVRVLPPAQPIP